MSVDLNKRKLRETYVIIQIEALNIKWQNPFFPVIVMSALKTVSYYTLLNSEKSFLTLNCVTEHPEKISAIKAKWKILLLGHTAQCEKLNGGFKCWGPKK